MIFTPPNQHQAEYTCSNLQNALNCNTTNPTFVYTKYLETFPIRMLLRCMVSGECLWVSVSGLGGLLHSSDIMCAIFLAAFNWHIN